MSKTVFITGSVRNTGLAIARYFAGQGWDVILSSRDKRAAEETARREQRDHQGTQWIGVGMDPSDVSSIRAAFGEIRERFGRLDAFISNAANLGVGLSVLNADVSDWDAVMNANARGGFFGAQEAVRLMPDGGAILFISSVHAQKSIPGRILYTASKAAIGGMVRSLAVELGCMGIRVNSILAGAIRTDRWDCLTEDEIRERRGRYPTGRESSVDDIAAAAYFLCSDQAKTVTGIEMPVDSGISVCLLQYNKEWIKNDPNNKRYWERGDQAR